MKARQNVLDTIQEAIFIGGIRNDSLYELLQELQPNTKELEISFYEIKNHNSLTKEEKTSIDISFNKYIKTSTPVIEPENIKCFICKEDTGDNVIINRFSINKQTKENDICSNCAREILLSN